MLISVPAISKSNKNTLTEPLNFSQIGDGSQWVENPARTWGGDGSGLADKSLAANTNGWIEAEYQSTQQSYTFLSLDLNPGPDLDLEEAAGDYMLYIHESTFRYASIYRFYEEFVDSGVVAQPGDKYRLKRTDDTITSEYYRGGVWTIMHTFLVPTTEMLYIKGAAIYVSPIEYRYLLNPRGRNVANNLDSNAEAFISASGITSSIHTQAANRFILDWKKAGLWVKTHALYLFLGGTADRHKWNAKDPRDLDEAFRLTFGGTWTHDESGSDPTSLTSYADTHLIPSDILQLNSAAIQYYSKDDSVIAQYDVGANTPGTGNIQFVLKWTDNNTYIALNCGQINAGNIVSDTRGLFTLSRTASNAIEFYKGGTSLFSSSTASTSRCTKAIFLGRNDDGTGTNSAQRKCAGAAIMTGLTDAEVIAANDAWQTFQTMLGRQE